MSAIICPLPDWKAVSVAGPDAQAFLQGQFTNDVVELVEGRVQLSGYCSPKGRLLANFALAAVAGNEYVLVVPADLATGFVRRLRMFVLRAKVVIAELESPVIGLHDAAAADNTPAGLMRRRDGVTTIGLPDGRVLAVCAPDRAAAYWDDAARTATPASSAAWDALAIRAGVPVVTAATADRFVPQMLNWELLGGVSFRKGCYTGQEIVARMQYLGRLKERLYRARTSATGVVAGAPIFGREFGDQSCGTIVNAAPSETSGTELLAVLQVASAVRDVIRMAPADDSPELALLPLPYAVPAAERGATA
jgi:folate-binding protein YgfZ